MPRLFIPRDTLQRLYLTQKLSTRKIAQKYYCGKTTIVSKLREYNIVARTKSEALKLIPRPDKYKISSEELKSLYEDQKLSAHKIADLFECSPSAIARKLIKFNIPRRTDVEGIILTNDERCRKIAKAVARYPKKDFNGSLSDRAYLMGFSFGDMNVEKKKYGSTIYAASCTTKIEQLSLMQDLFGKYGHVRVNISRRKTKTGEIDHFLFTANLNDSFNFLLDKEDNIEAWILRDNQNFLLFLAGYIDAEGSFGVYNGFGSFALGSYDKNILYQIYTKLKYFKIETELPYLRTQGGYIDKRGVKTLRDFWTLRIKRIKELCKFIKLIKSHIKHSKRKTDLLRVKENLKLRLNNS